MGYCLPVASASKFLEALRDGTIDPEKLINMSSEGRRTFFENIVGKADAEQTNALLESKLLLKDQKRGMVAWAKQLTGITKPAMRDLLSRIEKMDSILSQSNQQAFLEDLAERKLGTHVTMEEANQIAAMSKDVSAARATLPPDSPIGSDERLNYGAKKVALQNLVNKLKLSNAPGKIAEVIDEFRNNDYSAAVEGMSRLGAVAKSLKAVGDLSSLFRQGYKVLFTNPSVWARNAVKTFSDFGKQLTVPGTNDAVMDAVKADIYSRPNALDGTYARMKIDIGNQEEAIPSSVPERIPVFGRVFKATQTGFESFLYRSRADIADKYVEIAKASGVDLTKTNELVSIGKLVNSLTGRGDLGRLQPAAGALNNVFFSPKFIKSNLDTLTAHQFQRDVTPFVRKQAALATLKVVVGAAGILGIAHMIQPKSVDFDARSANFGKIKIGKIAFDVTGGSGSLVTLAARLIMNSTKSTTSGKITSLNTGKFGSETSANVIEDFLTNKESPVASVVMDMLNRTDYYGNKLGLNWPTAEYEAQNAFTPFPIQNVEEATPQIGLADSILSEIADALGIYITIPAPPKKK